MPELKPPSPFLELLSAELETLKRTGRKLSFRAGDVIFNQGDVGDGIYIVEEGEVEISAVVDGERGPSLSRLPPRVFLGEMAVIDDQPRSATAAAAVDSVVAFVPRDETLRALSGSP